MKSYDVNLYAEDEILIKKTLKKEKSMKNKSQNTKKSKKSKQMDLSVNEALILQQVYEDGVDDVDNIVDQAGMPKKVTMNVLTELKSKGLLTVIQQTYGKILVSVTSQGKKLVNAMWPEAVTFTY
ncbi:MAG: hypothetical protein HXL13_01495 [Candidatus Nanosynbacter sp.]|jgi:hypothetical protein cdiviTM7_02395|nr:hypothetical protein [Candidatus Nanosynbacter sp.]TWP08820.1 hypothetical protein EUA77_03645 [TM7 phylum sp. oral taxon 351]